MKKLLLTLGTVATVVVPVTTVVACGSETPTTTNGKLAAQAAKISEVETTTHDFVRVGGPELRVLGDGIVGFGDKANQEASKDKLGEFRSGDYFEFVFKNPKDIKHFTEKVQLFDGKTNIEIDKPLEDGGLFTLSATKKNVVRLTIGDVLDSDKILSGLRLVTNGLNESTTESISLPFYVTPNRFTNSNIGTPDKGFLPSTFYDSSKSGSQAKGVHLPGLFTTLNKRIADKAHQDRIDSLMFDETKIKWGTVDLTKLKDGDIITFEDNGMPQLVRIYIEDGKNKMVQCISTGPFAGVTDVTDTFGPMTVVDATHFTHPGKERSSRVDGKWITTPATPVSIEVTKMGTL